jgi:5-methylcytosine-specific restriction endonuclease McrA
MRLTVHHLVPRESGGSNDTRNLVALCPHCHDAAELLAEEERPMAVQLRRELLP